MRKGSETANGQPYERVEILESDTRTLREHRRDRLFYALIPGLLRDYETLVKDTSEGRIPELDDDREVPGAHGAIITYNCTLGPSSINFYDAERWDAHTVEGRDAPISVEDIPTEKEEVLDFIGEHFYGENARIFENDKLIYTSAKLSGLSRLERIAKKVLKKKGAHASDLVWHCVGGAKEPDYKTGKYGNRTLASFAAAFFAGGYVYMRDTTQASEVSPGQVYEFGFDGLIRAVSLEVNLDAREEDCIDIDTVGGFENVCLVLTEYARNGGSEVRPVSRRLLTEEDIMYFLGSSFEEGSLWQKMKQDMGTARKNVLRSFQKFGRRISLV